MKSRVLEAFQVFITHSSRVDPDLVRAWLGTSLLKQAKNLHGGKIMKATRRTLKEAISSLLAVFLLLAVAPLAAFAQTETGQVTIKAVDPQGAVVVGATITAKSVDRG